MKRLAGCLLWIACLCIQVGHDSLAAASAATDEVYLQSLLKRARSARLHESRTWLVLMHYRRDFLGGGETSEVDDEQFFFSVAGKTDPLAEIEATIRAFFSSEQIGKHKQLPQCAFPARFRWLDSQLNFDRARMQVPDCPVIELWRQRINADSVSLIFSSYYLNNPASMFGHTLLRLDSADRSQPHLLDFALNYAAQIEADVGLIEYAWRGVTGGFDGRFSVFPYYDRVKLYNDVENRDLWEYNLNLEPEQIDFMLLHAWELANTRFDFYFLRENCSYHLLSLLEAADPTLDLRSHYRAWTLPTETIRLIAAQPGLVTGVTYRASLRSQAERRMGRLDARSRERARALSKNPSALDTPEWRDVSPATGAKITDAAIDLLRYQRVRDGEDAAQSRGRLHELLVQRSRLPPVPDVAPVERPPDIVPPDQGHDPARLELALGNVDRDLGAPRWDGDFVELSLQPGFHDLLANEDGQAPDSQIRIMSLSARYWQDSERWRVREAALLDIVSLYPATQLPGGMSWKIYLGWQQNLDGACRDCTPFIVNPGIGIAARSELHRKETWYAMLEADLQFDHELDDDYRGGFGARLGLNFDASAAWRIGLDARRTRYGAGARGYVSEVSLLQRIHMARNFEIRIDLREVEEYREGMIGVAHYF